MSDLTTRNNRATRERFNYADIVHQIDAMANDEPVPDYYVDEDGDEVNIVQLELPTNNDIGTFVGHGGNVDAIIPPNFHDDTPPPPPNLLQEIRRIQLETGLHIPEVVVLDIIDAIDDAGVQMYSLEAVHLAVTVLGTHGIVLPEEDVNSLIAIFEQPTNEEEEETEIVEQSVEYPTVNAIDFEIPEEIANMIPYDLNKLIEYCRNYVITNNPTRFHLGKFIAHIFTNLSKMPKTCETIANKLAKQKRNEHFFNCITQTCSMKEHTEQVCTSGEPASIYNNTALTSLAVHEPNVCKVPNCIHHQMFARFPIAFITKCCANTNHIANL
jgi:hypothetical protein